MNLSANMKSVIKGFICFRLDPKHFIEKNVGAITRG